MKKYPRNLLAGILVLGMAVISSAAVFAQDDDGDDNAPGALFIPIGTISACGVTSTATIVNEEEGIEGTITAQGTAYFESVDYTQSEDGFELSVQRPTQFTAVGHSEEFGDVVWSFAEARDDGEQGEAFITSNQPGASFPATSRIYFTAQATLGSYPGHTFRSVGRVELVNGNLTSFNPQNNESYTLGNSGGITFEDTDSSSGIRFVLPAMIVIVSPSNSSE